MLPYNLLPSFNMKVAEYKPKEYLRLEGRNNYIEMLSLNLAIALFTIVISALVVVHRHESSEPWSLFAILFGGLITLGCFKNIIVGRGRNYLNDRIVFSREGIELNKNRKINRINFIPSEKIDWLIITKDHRYKFLINRKERSAFEFTVNEADKIYFKQLEQEVAEILNLHLEHNFSTTQEKTVFAFVSPSKKEEKQKSLLGEDNTALNKGYKPKHFSETRKGKEIFFKAKSYSRKDGFFINPERKIFWLVKGLTSSVSYSFSEISSFKIKIYGRRGDDNIVEGRLSFLDPDGYRVGAMHISIPYRKEEALALIELKEDLIYLAKKMNELVAEAT